MSVPQGAVPTYSLYGRPAVDARLAYIEDARVAPPSAPFVGRGNKCSANDDTCEAKRAKGTQFCVGHLRSALKGTGKTDGTSETNEG